jgi:bifunctional ADP-heptose synthase (sugar kinase/adenylyltransferase)
MANLQEIQQLVQQVAGRLRQRRVAIAVLGDMILDNAIEGVPGGRHPDMGIPILRQATIQESIGGAGNIALALSRLGIDVTLFGVVGSDLTGRQLRNLLERQPFPSHLVTEPAWPTPHKDWVYERQGDRVAMVYRIDYDRPPSGRARTELVGEFRARRPAQVDVVILTDHNLGSIGPEAGELIGLAREVGAKLVAIPRSKVLHGQPVDAIVINSPEMRSLYNADSTADARALAARYAREFGQDVFLTLMAEGIVACPAGTELSGTLIPGYPLENAHWMGVRDMATAVLAVGLALGLDPVTNARLANAFRSLVAGQRGNGRVFWRDIFQFVGCPCDEVDEG